MKANWEEKASIYNTFRVESEIAIRKFNNGEITQEQLNQSITQSEVKLDSALKLLA